MYTQFTNEPFIELAYDLFFSLSLMLLLWTSLRKFFEHLFPNTKEEPVGALPGADCDCTMFSLQMSEIFFLPSLVMSDENSII